MKAIIVILLIVSSAYSQHGVGPGWGSESALPKFDNSKSQRGVLYNNMAVSSSGRVFILTSEVNVLNGLISGNYLYYSDNGGVTWTSPQLFTPATLTIGASPMKLAMDRNNILHILWSAKNPSAVFYSRYDHDLNLLADTVRVGSRMLYNEFAVHLTTDRRNRLHAIWHEGNVQLGNTTEVYYSRSTSGGSNWSSPLRLSNNDGRHSAFPRAQFDAVNSDTLAIAWRDSVSVSSLWDIYMSVSTNGGVNWSLPFAVVTGPNLDSDPDVIMDSYNRIHLSYHQYPQGNPFFGANVRYSYSDNLGAGWHHNPFLQLSQSSMRSHLIEGNRYDSLNNNLWIVWKDERDFTGGMAKADIILSYSLDRGSTWSLPEFATDRDSMSVGFKAGAVLPDGDFSVNYEVTSSDNLLQVYFRKKENPLAKRNLDLSCFIEGLYDSTANLMRPDTISVFLRNSLTPFEIVDSSKSLIDSLGKGRIKFTTALNGVPYYIVINHRNSIETWSSSAMSFINDTLRADFTASRQSAYGDNLKAADNSPERFAVFSGDVNKDGTFDGADLRILDNDVFSLLTGDYIISDLNGDGMVDATDFAICDNNAAVFIGVIRP